MEQAFKRVNILLRSDQYEKIQALNLNLSGLVRDLIDDRFSERKVILAVTPEGRALYDKVISNFGASDAELEKFLRKALDLLLEEKTKAIAEVRKRLKR